MITIRTADLVGILTDTIPFASPDEDFETYNAVRLEWDGHQLHTLSTDRYRIAWSTWDPDDEPETDQQDDLFTTWGGADQPWHVQIPLADAKDIVSAYKLPAKEAVGVPLTVEQVDGQLRVVRARETGHSAITMVIRGLDDADWIDPRTLLAKHDTVQPAGVVAYTAKLLADFAKVRPRGALRLTHTAGPTLVNVGERFSGAIVPVKEGNDDGGA